MLKDKIKAYQQDEVNFKINPTSYKQDNPWFYDTMDDLVNDMSKDLDEIK